MKKLFVLLLCGIFCLSLFAGCTEKGFMNTPSGDTGSTSDAPASAPEKEPDGQGDGSKDQNGEDGDSGSEDVPSGKDDPNQDTPSPSEPEDPSGSDDREDPDPPEGTDPDHPTEPSKPTEPTQPEKDTEKETYAYRPHIFDQIPTISIQTSDGSDKFITEPNLESKYNGTIEYVSATIGVDGPEGMCLSALPAQVKARGNYTLEYDKKPIRIKFEQKQNLLGLNEGKAFKSWVLLADYKDMSALNNATAFYLGKTILGSDGYYCSDFCTVKVRINDTDWGVYLLAEQQEAKEGRANAVEADKDETGIDVGYLVEYDGYYSREQEIPNGGDPTFTIDYGGTLTKQNGADYTPFQIGYTVKSDLTSETQRLFLQSYLQNAFRILRAAAYENKALRFNADFTGTEPADCTPQEAVEAVVDVRSLADTYILQEIACDPDMAWSSFYLSLDMREGGRQKLVFEAPWDYDSAFGIKWNTANSAYGMYAANQENPWISVLIRTPFFRTLVREKWQKLCKYDIFKTALSLIEEQTASYGTEFEKSLKRWPSRLWGIGELTYEMNAISTQANAAKHLSTWLHTRLNYLNSVFGDGSDVLTGKEWVSSASAAPFTEKHRFEAETCDHHPSMQYDDWYPGASGGGFLGNVQPPQGSDSDRTIVLTVNAAEETDAYLRVGLSKRAFEADFWDWFALFVNGEKMWFPPCPIEACKKGEEEWGAWTAVDLGYIHLQQGENKIVLNTVSSVATNLDYFDLLCDTTLEQISDR